MSRVLVVDDDPIVLKALVVNMRARGYDVHAARDGASALRVAGLRSPDLVVLELGLPDMEGTAVISGLRGWTTVPIIVLTGRTDQIQKVAALDCGADDYVTKPFGIGELLARMRAVSRRVTAVHTPTATLGAWLVDLNAHRVRPAAGAGDDQKLTPTEWRVLEILVRNPGRLVTKRHLLHEVWGPGYDSETGCLRLYLAQLRRKLEPDPAHPVHLLTETGMGYRFEPGDTRTGGSSVGESLSPMAAAEWHDHVLSWRTDLTSARTKVPPTAAATRGSRRKFADACDARARRDRDRVTTDSTSSRSPRVAPWRVGTETRVES